MDSSPRLAHGWAVNYALSSPVEDSPYKTSPKTSLFTRTLSIRSPSTRSPKQPNTKKSEMAEVVSPAPSSLGSPAVQRKDDARGFFSTPTPSKLKNRRKGSIHSILSLASFGSKNKQNTLSPGSSEPQSFKRPKRDEGIGWKGAVGFRCDIHSPNSQDYLAAEKECQQIVREAGGTVVDNFLYPGGFLYELASPDEENPLDDGDETVGGGYITITPWIRFQAPQFNPLRMHPVERPHIRSPLIASATATPLPPSPTRHGRVGSWIDGVKRTVSAATTQHSTKTEYYTPPIYLNGDRGADVDSDCGSSVKTQDEDEDQDNVLPPTPTTRPSKPRSPTLPDSSSWVSTVRTVSPTSSAYNAEGY